MNNKIKVSVIIPSYNNEKFIEQAIASAQNQTLREIEIIIVDDCSTDNSRKIIEKLQANDHRIKSHFFEKNSGSGAARNHALDIVSGEFFFFLDSDDLFHNKLVLKKLYYEALKNNVEICGGNILMFDVVESAKPYVYEGASWLSVFFTEDKLIKTKDFLYPIGYVKFLYKTELMQKNKIYFPDYRRRQDQVWALRIFQKTKEFYGIDFPVYLYRLKHKKVIWDFEKLKGHFLSVYDCCEICKDYPMSDQIIHYFNDYRRHIEIALNTLKNNNETAVLLNIAEKTCSLFSEEKNLKLYIMLDQVMQQTACPICNNILYKYSGRLSVNNLMPQCCLCKSVEWHRAIRIVWNEILPFIKPGRTLQFSDDPSVLKENFSSYEISIYNGENSLNLQQINRKDNTYEYIICNHVLEHTADDRKSFLELLRILKPTGFLQVTVPNPLFFEKTDDWGYPKQEQHGHYRVYGKDFLDRFVGLTDFYVLEVYSLDLVTNTPEIVYFFAKGIFQLKELEEVLQKKFTVKLLSFEVN